MSKIILNGIEYSNGITYQEIQPVIYSTEERQVGVWKDGKPLYQKTYVINALPSSAGYQDHSLGLSNIDVKRSFGDLKWASGTTRPFGVIGLDRNSPTSWYTTNQITYTIENNSFIRIIVGTDRSTVSATITIQYTKTTDTAGSGDWTPSGVPAVHYDGNEKVIGTWFGETLYEKTWSGLSVSVTQNAWNTINAVTVSNLKDVINTTVYRTGGSGALTSVGVRSFSADNSGTHLQIIPLESQTINYVMTQYTKTTD